MYSVSQIFTQILHGWSYFFSYIKTTEGILDIEDVHESENIGLKKDKILRIIDVLNDASDIASEFDIYYERAHVFKNSVFFQRKKNIEEKQCKYSIKGKNPSQKKCILM